MKNSVMATPELSRPLRVDHVPLGGVEEKIIASPQEREALAQRFGILEIPRLEAMLNVERAEGGMFAVTGHIVADVVQQCVVTLEPVPEKVKDEIDVLFAPAHLIKDDRDGPLGDTGDAEPPEPIENGLIDLGELAAQHLAMALNPYPRKEGAEFGAVEVAGSAKGGGESTPANPFARLKKE